MGNSFDKRASVAAANSPWLGNWKPGANLANLFSLYPTKGDVTISTPTSIPTTLNGPIQIVRYGALIVNAAMTVTNPCRGLVILCDSLVVGASGSISMSSRAPVGSSKWVNQDIGIPSVINLQGKTTSQRAFYAWLASTGYAIFDPTLFACPVPGQGDVQADYANWPALMAPMIVASACGAAACTAMTGNSYASGATGNAGGTGGSVGGSSSASGGGGYVYNNHNYSGKGNVWGGGNGAHGEGTYVCRDADQYGEVVPNPNSTCGTGGYPGGAPLIIIVRGNVTINASVPFLSKGADATATGTGCGAGGAGGGPVDMYYLGTLTGTFTANVAGGAGTNGSSGNGASGGAGVARSATFTQMGWS